MQKSRNANEAIMPERRLMVDLLLFTLAAVMAQIATFIKIYRGLGM
jgi:hypothetical protein